MKRWHPHALISLKAAAVVSSPWTAPRIKLSISSNPSVAKRVSPSRSWLMDSSCLLVKSPDTLCDQGDPWRGTWALAISARRFLLFAKLGWGYLHDTSSSLLDSKTAAKVHPKAVLKGARSCRHVVAPISVNFGGSILIVWAMTLSLWCLLKSSSGIRHLFDSWAAVDRR